MPGEFTEGPEGNRRPERDEIEEHAEADETEKSAREMVREAVEEAERLEQEEQPLKDVIREIEEIEATEEKAKEVLEDTIRELRGLEEDLGYKIDEVREELHDESVNDMESKLEGPSLKDTSSESEEVKESRESEEALGSGESYIDGGDGTVSMLDTGGAAQGEVNSESEVEEHPEIETAETPEAKEEIAETEEIDASPEIRNSKVKPDVHEDNESDEVESSTPEKRDALRLTESVDEHSPVEHESEESKRECRKQETVPEHEDMEKSVCDESDEIANSDTVEDKRGLPEREQESGEDEVDELHEEEMAPDSREREQEVTENAEESVEGVLEVEENDNPLEDTPPEVSESVEPTCEDEELELPVDVPEEMIHKIEEMLDELEALEDEKVDDSRVIVEAMTGKKHIDRSLEPRSSFPETEEDIQRRERERVREKVAEFFGKLSAAERRNFKERVRARLKNEDDLDSWLSMHSSLKASPDFKQNYEDAMRYLRGKRVGGIPRLISELWKVEVERIWTQLVAAVIRRRVLGLPVSRMTGKKVSKEWTQEHLDGLLSEHKHLTKHVRFKVRYRNAVSWIVLMMQLRDGAIQMEPPIDVLKDLSREFLISNATIRSWLRKESKPMLVVQLERLLGIRAPSHGWQIPLVDLKTKPNELGIDRFRTILQSKRGVNPRTLELLKALMLSSKYAVWFTHFPSEYTDILVNIMNNKDRLERDLSSDSCRISLAVYSNRLFVYRKKIDLFLWPQLLEDEFFYLDRGWKRSVLGEVLGKMNLKNLKELSFVMRELTGYGEGTSVPVGGINADLQSKPNHLMGRSLGFVLDVMDLGISQVRNRITAIGKSATGNWQIRAPRFPEGIELQEILARLYAIIASDGHINRKTCHLLYFEKDPDRKLRVREILVALGDVWIHEYRDPTRADTFQLPTLLGRLLHRLGIPLGDKVLQSISIPPFIMNGPPEVQSAYLQELIPEEGAITYAVYGGLKILWGRSVVLHEERTAKKYATQKYLDRRFIQFIKKHGKYEIGRDCYRLSAGRLRGLKKSKDETAAKLAHELERIARFHKNKLQLGEQRLCSALSIKTGRHLCYVRFYVRSGRVSAHWEAHTRSQKDVEIWWRKAPPNDVRKRARLDDYFSEKGKDDEKLRNETPA